MIAYFDCFSGISGDMILGAIIDAGIKLQTLKKELNKLNIKYDITAQKTERSGISATKINIKGNKKFQPQELYNIINNASLDKTTKATIIEIIKKLEAAEKKIHSHAIERKASSTSSQAKTNHIFHELADIDTIIDVSGAIIGLNLLKIDEVYSSPLPLGKGFVQCAHGKIPIPAPATIQILKNIPVYGINTNNELVTPTGAAIISTIAKKFCTIPQMRIKNIGYGAGDRIEPQPNLLRIIIGEPIDVYDEDTVELIETNIDNMNPEFYSYVMNKLFENGAIDVFFTPIYMKQNRPATMFSVISPIEKTDDILRILFTETSTLGVRIQQIKRKKTYRLIKEIETKFGKVKVKFSIINDKIVNIAPEYADCEKIAKEHNIPIKTVYEEIKKQAYGK